MQIKLKNTFLVLRLLSIYLSPNLNGLRGSDTKTVIFEYARGTDLSNLLLQPFCFITHFEAYLAISGDRTWNTGKNGNIFFRIIIPIRIVDFEITWISHNSKCIIFPFLKIIHFGNYF